MYKRIGIIPFIILIVIVSSFGQQTLTSYIKLLEERTSYKFNYNIEETDQESVIFLLDDEPDLDQILVLFSLTKFELVVDDNILLVVPAGLETYLISLTLVDHFTGMPLSGGNMYTSSNCGTSSNEHGFLEMTCKTYKNDSISFSYVGYKTLTMPISQALKMDTVFLSFDDYLMEVAVVVANYLYEGITEGESYNGLNISFNSEYSKLRVIQNDLFRTLQKFSGITTADETASNLLIRGHSPDQNMVSWEGATLYNSGHMFNMVSAINPFLAEEVDIYKSTHGPDVDNKIGGVIDIKMKDYIPTKTKIDFGVGLINAHFNAAIPILNDKIGIYLGARTSVFAISDDNPSYNSYSKRIFQSVYDSYENELEEENESEYTEPIVDFQDLTVKAIINLSPKSKFQTSLLFANDNQKNLSAYPSIMLSGNDASSSQTLAWSNQLSYRVSSQDSFLFSAVHSSFTTERSLEFVGSNSITQEESSHNLLDTRIAAKWYRTINRQNILLAYEWDRKELGSEFETKSTITAEEELKTEQSAFFHHVLSQYRLKKNKSLLDIGIRTTINNQFDKMYFSPSLSYRLEIFDDFIFKSSAGYYNQYLRQVYNLVGGFSGIESTSWKLETSEKEPSMKASKVSSGFIVNKKNWLIDVEAYYHYTTGLAAQDPNVRNNVYASSNNILISKGVDFLIQRRINNWNGLLNYSLSSHQMQLQVDNVTKFLPANQDQTHIFDISNSYRLQDWEFSLLYQYKTGLPYTQVNNVVDLGDNVYELGIEQFNNARLISYLRLDASVAFNKTILNYKLNMEFTCLNILNRKNLGSRKYVISDGNSTVTNPELVSLTEVLLGRTYLFSVRVRM